jgi:microcin C transport system substrate-binding protein
MRSSVVLLLLLLPGWASAEEIQYRHAHSYVFEPKYTEDFEHFDFVNPDAPRGGQISLSASGGFDSFNHFAGRGRVAAGLTQTPPLPPLFYDRLLEQSADEPAARYGLLAEGVAWADDFSWIAFKLREGAYWHDGEPITVDDVIFTFDTLKEHGSVAIRTNLMDVIDVEQIGPREIRFINNPDGVNNRNVLQHLGAMDILPKHYWETRDPSRTTTVPPLGSGPYRIADYHLNRYVIYERVEHWADDLPIMRGRYNFDEIKFDYFRDQNVMRQALRNGVFDLMIETVAKNWSMDYDFPAVQAGLFRKWSMELGVPSGLWFPVFWNLRQARFQDIRVREALWLLFDFRYTNRVLLHDYYDHATSFFQNSPMAHEGLPSADELALLEQFRGRVPERVFTEPYQPPPNAGYGYNRDSLGRALELFADAGWTVDRNGRLVHEATGQHFRIQFVLVSPALVRMLMPYIETLQRVGIDASARAFEQSNYVYRMRHRQFDGGMQGFSPGALPGPALRMQFSSRTADIDASLNWAGVRDPAVDYLMERIIRARDETELLAATRAFDRVMLWNFYFVPGMADTGVRHVFWDRFGIPDGDNLQRRTYFDAWWYDPERSARVDRGMAGLNRQSRTPEGD